jgi:membrane associated rhomboid family serine protease
MQQDRNPIQDIGKFFRSKGVLARLILINAALWVAIGVLRVIGFLFNFPDNAVTNFVADNLAVPASLPSLYEKPWSLLTYMFLHVDFLHILFNMLWLFWFGKIFLEFLREKQLLLIYLLGGLAGGILYIFFYNIFPVFEKSVDQSIALGASASVMAVVTAISFYVPGYSVYMLLLGKVRIFYIALALFVMDFFMIRSDNAGGHIAHIGGALFGLSYIIALRRGMNFREIFGDWRNSSIFRFLKRKQRPQFKTYYGEGRGRPLSDEEYNKNKAEQQKRIDTILEKIARSGYGSLSKEEKDILFKVSNSDKNP